MQVRVGRANLVTTNVDQDIQGIKNCHLLFGHLGKYTDWNPDCIRDVENWHIKINKKS